MPKLRRGGGIPGAGMVAANLGNDLRLDLERLCQRRGITLTEFLREVSEQGLVRDKFWKFAALRYLIQGLRIVLCSSWVKETLEVSREEQVELRKRLREYEDRVVAKGNRESGGPYDPHLWGFKIQGLDQVLGAL